MTVLADNFAASSAMPADVAVVVRADKLSKSLDERPVLREVDLSINRGEFVGLLGANGAGKSTLLRMLSTLIAPSAGTLSLFGLKLPRHSMHARAKLGLIAHQPMLYRDLSARENLEFFGKLYSLANPAQRARQLLDMVGLSDRANDPVKAFSRGMTQRVAIARALLHDPELLLADEPFDGLDAPSIAALEQLLNDLNAAGKTIVMVNHDIEQTLRLAERAVVLRGGQIVVDQPTMRLYAREVLSEVSG